MFIGNTIYPAILSVIGEEYTGRVTGMILDEKAVNIEQLLFDQQYLSSKVTEAYYMLKNETNM